MEKSKYPKSPKTNAKLNDMFDWAARTLLAKELKTLNVEEMSKNTERLNIIARCCVNTFRKIQSQGKSDKIAFGKTIGTFSKIVRIRDHNLKKYVVESLIGQ